MVYRIATHDTRPASAAEVYAMSLDRIIEAHDVLDAIDAYREAHKPEAR